MIWGPLHRAPGPAGSTLPLINPISHPAEAEPYAAKFTDFLRLLKNSSFLTTTFRQHYLACAALTDPDFKKYHYGMNRAADTEIASEILARLSLGAERITGLELAAGDSLPVTNNFGSPWLSRFFSLAFPGKVSICLSDVKENLLPEIETDLFGLEIKKLKIESLPYTQEKYDFIFARNMAPNTFDATYPFFDLIFERNINPGGCLIMHGDCRPLYKRQNPDLDFLSQLALKIKDSLTEVII